MKPRTLPILLGLVGVAALAWWQQARLQPSTDAETAARLA